MHGGLLWGLVKAVAALAFVLGLFAFGVHLLRRLSLEPRGRGDFRVRRRLALSPRVSVVELEHRRRRYLLLVGPDGARPLPPAAALGAEEGEEETPGEAACDD